MSSFKYEEPYERQDGRPSFSRLLPASSCVCYADAGFIITQASLFLQDPVNLANPIILV